MNLINFTLFNTEPPKSVYINPAHVTSVLDRTQKGDKTLRTNIFTVDGEYFSVVEPVKLVVNTLIKDWEAERQEYLKNANK